MSSFSDEQLAVLDAPFVDWAKDVETKPEYAAAPPEAKTEALQNYSKYTEAFIARKMEQAQNPEEIQKLQELGKAQKDWEAQKAQELAAPPAAPQPGIVDNVETAAKQATATAAQAPLKTVEGVALALSDDSGPLAHIQKGLDDLVSEAAAARKGTEDPNPEVRDESANLLGHINDRIAEQQAKLDRAKAEMQVPLSPAAQAIEDAGASFREAAKRVADTMHGQENLMSDFYGADPNDQSVAAQIGRGVGNVWGMAPTMLASGGTGLVLGASQAASMAYSETYNATLADLRTKMPQAQAEEQAHAAATDAAGQSLVGMGTYLFGGRLAAEATAPFLKGASPFVKAIVGGAAAGTTNMAVSAANRLREGKSIKPTWEGAAQDWAWALPHVGQTYREAAHRAAVVKAATADVEGTSPVAKVLRNRVDKAKELKGEGSPQHLAAQDHLSEFEDRAHHVLHLHDAPNADVPRAKAFAARMDAFGSIVAAFRRWAIENGKEAELDKPAKLRAQAESKRKDAVAAEQVMLKSIQPSDSPEIKAAKAAVGAKNRSKAEAAADEADAQAQEAAAALKAVEAEFDGTVEGKAHRARMLLAGTGLDEARGLPDAELARIKDAMDKGEKFSTMDDIHKFLAGPEAPELQVAPPIEKQGGEKSWQQSNQPEAGGSPPVKNPEEKAPEIPAREPEAKSAEQPELPLHTEEERARAEQRRAEFKSNLGAMEAVRAKIVEAGGDPASIDRDIEAYKSRTALEESLTPEERIKANTGQRAFAQDREALVRVRDAAAAAGMGTSAIDERIAQFDKVKAIFDPVADTKNELATPPAPDLTGDVFADVAPTVTPESRASLAKWAKDRLAEHNPKAVDDLLAKHEAALADPNADRSAITKAKAYVSILNEAKANAKAAADAEANRRAAAKAELDAAAAADPNAGKVLEPVPEKGVPERVDDTAKALAQEFGGDAPMAKKLAKTIQKYISKLQGRGLPEARVEAETDQALSYLSKEKDTQAAQGRETLIGALRKNFEATGDPLKVLDKKTGKPVAWSMDGLLSNRTKPLVGESVVTGSANEPNAAGVEPVENAPAPEPATPAEVVAKETGVSTKTALDATLQKFLGFFKREQPGLSDDQALAALHTAFTVAMNDERFKKGIGDGIVSKAFLDSAAATADAQTDPAVKAAVAYLRDNVRAFRRSFIESLAAESNGLHARLEAAGISPSENALYEGREYTLMDALLQTKGTAEVRDIARAAAEAGKPTKELRDALTANLSDPKVQDRLKDVAYRHGVVIDQSNLRGIVSLNAQDLATMEADPAFPESTKILLDAHRQVMGEEALAAAAKSDDAGIRSLVAAIQDRLAPGTEGRLGLVHNWLLQPGMSQGAYLGYGGEVHVAPWLSNSGKWEATVLHEVLHPLLNGKFKAFESGNFDALTDAERKACEGIRDLIGIAQAEADKRVAAEADPDKQAQLRRDLFGSRDRTEIKMNEFLNEALNHKPFQDFLKSIDAPEKTGGSVFQRLTNWLTTLLTGKPTAPGSLHERAMEHLLDVVGNKDRALSIEDRNEAQRDYLTKALGPDESQWNSRDFKALIDQFSLTTPSGKPSAASREEALRIAQSTDSGLSKGERLAVLKSEKTFSPGEVSNYIRSKYADMIRSLGTDLSENYRGYVAKYVVGGKQGGGYVEINPMKFGDYTKDQIDAVMREEFIHAASGEVLRKRGEDWVSFFTDLAKSMPKSELAKLKPVYTSAENLHQAGAEYFRAGVQKILYGKLTEEEISQPAMKKVIALVKSVLDFFRGKGETDPRFKEVFEETVRMMRAADPDNVVAADYPEVSHSMSVGIQKVAGKTFAEAFSKANPEVAKEGFVDTKNPAEAERLLSRFVHDPAVINAGGSSRAADGEKRTVAMNFPDEGTAKFLGITDGLKARVAHALTEDFDRKTFSDDKVRTASLVPQTIREPDLVGTRDFKYRGKDVDVVTYAKLYHDPESPTGVRWHVVEAISPKGKGAGYFDTQFSSSDEDLGRALQARVIGIGQVIKQKALPEAGRSRESAAEAGAQGPLPVEPSKQSPDEIAPANLSDITKGKTVQDIMDGITNLEAKQKRMEASGDYVGAAKVAAQIAQLDAEWNTHPDVSQSAPAMEFVSPNDSEEPMDFKAANEQLKSQKQQDFRQFVDKVDSALGHDTTVTNAIGDWADGAEPTTVTTHSNDIPYETLRVSTALKSAFANQKAGIPFKVEEGGEQHLYQFDIPGKSLAEARDILEAAGIPFRTLVERDGGTGVYVFDADGSAFDAVDKLVTENKYDKDYYTGRGEFLGSWDSRSEGKDIYRSTVEGEISRLGLEGQNAGPDSPASLRAASLRSLADEAGLGAPAVSSSEPAGLPAAVQYLKQFPEGPLKGSSRVLIEHNPGEPLLEDLTPETTRTDLKGLLKKADKLILDSINKRGQVKVGRVAFNDFLGDYWKKTFPGREPGWKNFQDTRGINRIGKILSYEVANALSKSGSGADWYRTSVDGMYDTLGKEGFPELADRTSRENFVFSTILAATSNGQDIVANITDALKIYNAWKAEGSPDRLPETLDVSRKERAAGMEGGIRKVNALVDQQGGWEKAREFMLRPMTVKDLSKDTGVTVAGEHSDHTVIGAMVLGPKIGSFWGNLNGHFDSTTMDLWFTRTMNRLSGDTTTLNPEKLQSAFEKIAATPDLPAAVKADLKAYKSALKDQDKNSWVAIPGDFRAELPALYTFLKTTHANYAQSGYADRSVLNKAAKDAVILLDGGEDAPDNGAHRQWMRDVVDSTQKQLQAAGINITNADLQAILWFHEKDLYTKYGATTTRGERTDYAEAAARILGSSAGRKAIGSPDSAGPLDGQPAERVRPAEQPDFFGDQTLSTKPKPGNAKAEADVVSALTGEAPEVSQSEAVPAPHSEEEWRKSLGEPVAEAEAYMKDQPANKLVKVRDDGDLPTSNIEGTHLFKTEDGDIIAATKEDGQWDLHSIYDDRVSTFEEGAISHPDSLSRLAKELQVKREDLSSKQMDKLIDYEDHPAAQPLWGLPREPGTPAIRDHRFSAAVDELPALPRVSQSEPVSPSRLSEASQAAQDQQYDQMGDPVDPLIQGLHNQRGAPATFTPTRFGASDRRVSEALGRVRDLPEYAPVKRALEGKTYIKSTEGDMLDQAHSFLAAHDNDLPKAFAAAEKTPGVSNDQAAVIQGLALKKTADIARAARESAVTATTAQRRSDLLTLAQHNEDLNAMMASRFMERSSLWGQEGRALRMVADLFGPKNWSDTFTRPIQKAQAKRLAKEQLPKDIIARLNYAAELAATSTATAMQRALDNAGKRLLPKDATPEEVQAQQDLHRALSSPLPVREEIVKSAVEMAVASGMANIERGMSDSDRATPEGKSFLDAWRDKLHEEATNQLNQIIDERLKGGKVDETPAPPLTPEERTEQERQKLEDLWANLGHMPLAETVFRLARATIAVSPDNPYSQLVHGATFDMARSESIRKAVLASVDMGQEIRKSVADRNVTKEQLVTQLKGANPELTDAQADLIAGAAESIYNNEVQKASAAALAKLAQPPKNAAKLDHDTRAKILQLVNMGGFSNEAVYNALAPKYHLPTYSKDAVAALEAEAKALQELPEGSIQRNEAAQRLSQSILKATVAAGGTANLVKHYSNVAASLWTAGVLSHPQTHLVVGFSTSLSTFMEATAEARGYYEAAIRNGATKEQASAFYGDIARAFRFSFGKDATNTSVRVLMEAERALTEGTTRWQSMENKNLALLDIYHMTDPIEKTGNAIIDAISSGQWKEAAGEMANLVGGVAKTMAERAVHLDAKGAATDYLATQKYVSRALMATHSINMGLSRNMKLFMEKRYLALMDPRLNDGQDHSEEEINKIQEEIGRKLDGSDAEELEATRQAALATAEHEASLGQFGTPGTRSYALQKARRAEQLIEEGTYGQETLQKAYNYAADASYLGDAYGLVGQVMNGVFGADMRAKFGPLGGLITPINPFPKIASNIINQAITYSPYGFLRATGKNLGSLLPEGNKYRREAPEYNSVEYHSTMAKATAGTVALGVLGGLVGLAVQHAWDNKDKNKPFWFAIHGNGPSDPALRAQWLASGGKPYSIRVGNASMEYIDIPGLNLVAGAMGTAHDELIWGRKEYNQKGAASMLASVGLSCIGTTMNRHMLGGVSTLFDIVSNKTSDAARQSAFSRLAASYVSGFTSPGLLQTFSKMATGETYETRTWQGWALQFVPMGPAIAGQPRYNVLGEPIKKDLYETLFGRVAPVIPEEHPILTPLTEAALKIPNPQRYAVSTDGGQKIRQLTEQEYYDYGKAYGAALKAMLPEARVQGLVAMAERNPVVAQEQLDRMANFAKRQAMAEVRQTSGLRRASGAEKKIQQMLAP